MISKLIEILPLLATKEKHYNIY